MNEKNFLFYDNLNSLKYDLKHLYNFEFTFEKTKYAN